MIDLSPSDVSDMPSLVMSHMAYSHESVQADIWKFIQHNITLEIYKYVQCEYLSEFEKLVAVFKVKVISPTILFVICFLITIKFLAE